MSNHCQGPLGLPGVPDLDPAESFSIIGSIFWTHLLSWDQLVKGEIKQLLALDLSMVWCLMQCGQTLSRLITSLPVNIFCCLLLLFSGRQFSSVTMCLFLCDSSSGFLVCFWLLGGSFLFLTVGLGSLGRTFDWLWLRLFDTHVSLVASRLLWHSMSETRCSWTGDVWIATSITLVVTGLAECSMTKVLSSLRASSIKWCSLFWSSLRYSSLLLNFSRLELRSVVASPL